MKGLLAGIVLIIVLGFGGFVYRNALERTSVPVAPAPQAAACTAEAKVCPDGSAVGRTGPSCSFAACPLPNIELADAHVAFKLPPGYDLGVQQPGADGEVPGLIAFYQKPAKTNGNFNYLSVYSYPIPSGKTAQDVIISNTRFEPSDKPATSIAQFTSVTIGTNTYYQATIERFEGQISTVYYLPRTTDVLGFVVIERDVADWANPALDIASLPEHAAIRSLLQSLQVSR